MHLKTFVYLRKGEWESSHSPVYIPEVCQVRARHSVSFSHRDDMPGPYGCTGWSLNWELEVEFTPGNPMGVWASLLLGRTPTSRLPILILMSLPDMLGEIFIAVLDTCSWWLAGFVRIPPLSHSGGVGWCFETFIFMLKMYSFILYHLSQGVCFLSTF